MRTLTLTCTLVFLAACQAKGDTSATNEQPSSDYTPVSVEPTNTDGPIEVYTPSPPSHYYAEKDGVLYSYIAAVSEEDRKLGKRAGNVVTYAYLGMQGDRHVLARVRPNGSIMERSSCRNPCRVITFENGEQLGFDEGSIIGGAYADAINGRLETAQIMPPVRQPEPTAPIATSPAFPGHGSPPLENWSTAEATLIAEWQRLSIECESAVETGIDTSPCLKRDNDVGRKLAAMNICYGKVYEDRAVSGFHRCKGNSLPLN